MFLQHFVAYAILVRMIKRHCPHCGQAILEGALFCLDCGSRLLGSAETAGARRLTGSTILDPVGIDDLADLPRGSYIFVVEGLDRGRRFDLLDQEKFSIGREGADISLTDPFVSRRHVEIQADGRRWLIHDRDSTNGSLVNDRRANGEELLDGDIIEIGYTTMVFRVKL